jgi:predicted nucleic acid-binding protein
MKKDEFDFDKMFRCIEKEPEFEVIGFGVEVFEEVTRLKKIPELHDRIIAATAKFYGAEVLTIDKSIS